MVISRVPLRISFVGGGSDLPGAGSPAPGLTISTAIDQYVYVMAKWRNDGRVIMNWREKETVALSSELQHELAREALQMLGIHQGIEISTFADVPGVGSGLGSSAATTVAIVQAASALTGIWLGPERLARAAVEVELERLGRKGGSQDQWISALGGLCRLRHEDGRCVEWTRHGLSPANLGLLERHFALFSPPDHDPGRNADDILDTKDPDDTSFRKCCADLVGQFEQALTEDDWPSLGNLLGQHDKLKRGTFGGYYPESGPELDKLDVFWKVCGAGASGHLLVAVKPETRAQTVQAVEEIWGRELPWSISDEGAQVIHAS